MSTATSASLHMVLMMIAHGTCVSIWVTCVVRLAAPSLLYSWQHFSTWDVSHVIGYEAEREDSWCAKHGVSSAANMQTKYITMDN